MRFIARQGQTLLLTAAVVCLAAGLMAGAQGAERKVIEITSFDQIRKIGQLGANSDTAYPNNAHYKLMNDIDASSSRRTAYKPGDLGNPYEGGIFDGQGFTIKGLYIVPSTGTDIGLFRYIFDSTSLVTNLRIEIDSMYGPVVGGIAGYNDGIISNCSVSGSVSGRDVGGLVGVNRGTITNCYATVNVGRGGSLSGVLGGLVGRSDKGTITNCYATGNVNGGDAVGGGLVGQFDGTITNCYATGNVNGSTVGGLVGKLVSSGSITKCYATGDVSGSFGGGLVGEFGSSGSITNCYAMGNVSGSGNVFGGLVGSSGGTIINCYSVGKVSGGSSLGIYVGGLTGSGTPSKVTNSYWDTETSTLTTSSGGGTGKSTAQMKTQSTYVDWNFDTVWTIRENVSYPTLQGLGGVTPSGTFTLRYRAAAGGYIALGDTVQTVEYGLHGTRVVAMPDDGYEFTMWSDGFSNFVRTDSNVTSNKTVTAAFCAAANIKSLTYRAGPGGSISGPVDQKVCGASNGLPVTATPNEGYKFVEWSDGKKDAARTDAGGTASAEFAASFVIKTYTLIYSAGSNGSLIGGDTVMTVAHGSDGGLVLALADDGYEFVKWSDDVTSNPRTDRSVSANIAVSAVFDTLRHNLSYYVSPAHGVLAGSAAQRVTHGSNGSAVYVTGANGYTFFEWSDGLKDSIRTDKNVQADIAVTAIFKDAAGNVSVSSSDRVIPPVNPSKEFSVITPIAALTAEFVAGPNPADKSFGTVNFFRTGALIKSATLCVYDASGNIVKKISINDKVVGGVQSKRRVGSWDLRDKRGRSVSDGTYLVSGALKTRDGKSEKVSVVVGVR